LEINSARLEARVTPPPPPAPLPPPEPPLLLVELEVEVSVLEVEVPVAVVLAAAVVLAPVVEVEDVCVVEVLSDGVSKLMADEAVGAALIIMAFPHFPEIGPAD